MIKRSLEILINKSLKKDKIIHSPDPRLLLKFYFQIGLILICFIILLDN